MKILHISTSDDGGAGIACIRLHQGLLELGVDSKVLVYLKKRNIPGVCAFIESLFTCLPVLGSINFIFIAIVLYTDIQPYLLVHMPWIKLRIFMLALTFLVGGMMILVYKFVLPSLWAFRGRQMFGKETRENDEGRNNSTN